MIVRLEYRVFSVKPDLNPVHTPVELKMLKFMHDHRLITELQWVQHR